MSEIQCLHEMLGDTVNSSGVIDYVKLPRLTDVDVPHPEDLPCFETNLAQSILKQAEKVKLQRTFPADVTESISQHSWYRLTQRMSQILETLLRNREKQQTR